MLRYRMLKNTTHSADCEHSGNSKRERGGRRVWAGEGGVDVG